LIRITKPEAGPDGLDTGVVLVEAMCQARLDDPEAGGSRKRAFEFDNKVYGSAAVKAALRAAQHDKCCYCEGYFAAHSPGDIDHFRPKACVQQGRGDPLSYPGYYWLAYTWANLYYGCDICNRSGKKNLFPLLDKTQRLTSPDDPIAREQPLILDPSGPDSPRDHIRFNGPTPYGLTDVGRATIDIVKLDRGDLKRDRLSLLKQLRAYLDVLKLAEEAGEADGEEATRARAELARAVTPQAVYSSMAIDYLADPVD
jgi:hypothetical protein